MRLRGMRAIAGIVFVLAVVAGCGDGDAGEGQPTTSPTSDPTTAPSTPPSIEDINELVGVPEAGVENDCWLLDDFLLVGGDRKLIASGEEVRIVGQIDKNMMTTCQQGTPFVVESVELVE